MESYSAFFKDQYMETYSVTAQRQNGLRLKSYALSFPLEFGNIEEIWVLFQPRIRLGRVYNAESTTCASYSLPSLTHIIARASNLKKTLHTISSSRSVI